MFKIYEIGYNETLDDVSNKFNIPTDIIYRLNGELATIYPGMKIVIPNVDIGPYLKHIVQKGENVYMIGNKYGVNYKDILLLNGLNEGDYIYPNQELIILKNDYNSYISKENDTIEEVSKKLGINQTKLLKDNNSIYILPGQVLLYKKEKSA